MAGKKIVIGADHGGYLVKERLKKELARSGYSVIDVGAGECESADYPVYGFEVARNVSAGKASRGIAICKSGIGMSIIANKLPGVRAGMCTSVGDAVSSRQHNDANVLVLAAAKNGPDEAVRIMKSWLKTRSLKGRHARRVEQIKEYENKVFRKRTA
ncbi:MAG: RpiB/LacA/LacB family sugar-phosphate isomerase [Candidatus Omnitrophica bacterium]|nr:RpiB/LacA/LacB family sugar-phosphate isomerase [Candidatus Omnitrophota bacterium]MDD5488181.1 RpiB/LacA/LacB family sugar-phosphate isomerase [Candidatus Omnitrophota bacterium]